MKKRPSTSAYRHWGGEEERGKEMENDRRGGQGGSREELSWMPAADRAGRMSPAVLSAL